MDGCKWAFLVNGPRFSLECLPQSSPWWNLNLSNQTFEWEVSLRNAQHTNDFDQQVDLALQAIVRMNGIAVSEGHPGLIEMTHHVGYDSDNTRSATVPLRLAFKNNKLSGFGSTPAASIDFQTIDPDKVSMLGTLLDYWGQPNAETYEGLYKIYELIQAAAPEIPRSISNTQLRRLKHTCNHMASGPTARHADLPPSPLTNPLPLPDIRQMVRGLFQSYVVSITLT